MRDAVDSDLCVQADESAPKAKHSKMIALVNYRLKVTLLVHFQVEADQVASCSMTIRGWAEVSLRTADGIEGQNSRVGH